MMNKVNQTHISEKLIKIFKSAKKFFVNFDSIDLKVSYKKDNSPLTILDTEVDQFIRKELKKLIKILHSSLKRLAKNKQILNTLGS